MRVSSRSRGASERTARANANRAKVNFPGARYKTVHFMCENIFIGSNTGTISIGKQIEASAKATGCAPCKGVFEIAGGER